MEWPAHLPLVRGGGVSTPQCCNISTLMPSGKVLHNNYFENNSTHFSWKIKDVFLGVYFSMENKKLAKGSQAFPSLLNQLPRIFNFFC